MVDVSNAKSVNVMYPVGGRRNILRRVAGEVVASGVGPNGKYITVQTPDGLFRSLSLKKIVNF